MSRLVVLPFTFSGIVLLSSFQIAPTPEESESIQRVGRQEAKEIWLDTIKHYALLQNWRAVGHIAKQAIDDDITLGKIIALAEEIDAEPLLRATVAAHNIRELLGSTGIEKSDLFRIALFIETELHSTRDSLKNNYISRRATGLARTLEYDEQSGHLFIHLKSHGVDEIGRGVKKIVTKSILYDVEEPKLVAHCTSSYAMKDEVKALRKMQGKKGIVKLYASGERQTKEGEPVYKMMCKLYEGGTLSSAFSGSKKFTFKEKLIITQHLLEGLSAMHAEGLVHRDLTARNVLFEKRAKNEVEAVIADFGRVRHIDTAHGCKVQFNSRYLAPEGIVQDRLSGKDYFATDVFALGCILHRLHFEKSGPWIDKENLKNPTQPDIVKEAKFIYDLQLYREANLPTGTSSKDRFEQIILQMIHEDPAKRSSAKELLEAINQLIQDFEAKAAAKAAEEVMGEAPVVDGV